MNTKHHMPHGLMRKLANIAEELEPLPNKKDPILAAILGGVFGAIGLGLYLRRWQDVAIPFAILVVLLLLSGPTAGLSAMSVPVFWAVYGYRRVKASNAKLGVRECGFVEVEVISPPRGSKHSLRQLDELLDTGALSPGEYENRRRKLLHQ